MYFVSLFEFECGALSYQLSTDLNLFVALVGLVDYFNMFFDSSSLSPEKSEVYPLLIS